MTPTEKRLREALNEAMEWNWLDPDMPVEIVKRCEAALAAIPSETGGEDELVKRLRAEASSYADERGIGEPGSLLLLAGDRIESLQAQLASLRERVVEECAKVADEWTKPASWAREETRAMTGVPLATKIRALAKSPSVSGEKEKSDGPHL